MKKVFFVISSVICSLLTFSQTNCDALKKENEYLKKALSLNTPVSEIQNGDLTFSVTRVEGNIKSQIVTIDVLIKNKGRNLESFGSRVKSILDVNGNEYLLDKAYIGAKEVFSSMSADLFRDAPIKCKYVFKGIQPEIKIIKLFNYPVNYRVPGTNSSPEESAEFRDLTIMWK